MKYSDFVMEMSKSTGFEPTVIETVLAVMPDVLVSILEEKDSLKTPLGCFKLKKKGPKPTADYDIPLGYKIVLTPGTNIRYLSVYDRIGRRKRVLALQKLVSDFNKTYPTY